MLKLDLSITNNMNKITYYPLITDKIQLERERIGNCSKITFKVLRVQPLNFNEGDTVSLSVNGKGVFLGYVFSKQRTSEQVISVTAYDQIRYLKYKATMRFENKKVSDVLSAICNDRKLKKGIIDDTKVKVPVAVYEDKTYLDMILAHLEASILSDNSLYALYDDYGKICLKNVLNMKTKYLASAENMQDYDYTSSIDGDTYNMVSVMVKFKNNTQKEHLFADDKSVKRYGMLQFLEVIDDKTNPAERAKTRLAQYNKVQRTLSLKGLFGDVDIRGGSIIYVYIPYIGEIHANEAMMVEKVTHYFDENEHFMDVTVVNNRFSESISSGNGSADSTKSMTNSTKKDEQKPSSKGEAVIKEATKYNGYPYVWGADGPSSFDCSGLVSYVFRKNNIFNNGQRWVVSDFGKDTKYTYPVLKNELKPGDLCIKYNPDHIAIYIGNGKTFEAKNPKAGCGYGVLDGRGFTTFKRLRG